VRVPAGGLRGELRAIKVVWQRELIRFSRDRLRIVTALVQPALFLFVLGGGLSRIASGGTEGVDLRTFIFPGVLAMAVLFTAMFSAASIVWDREYGFLREMLVAPVRRSSLVLGKCLGGATVAGFQGVLVLALAPLVHVPFVAVMVLEVIGLQLLLAFMITAFGVMAAVQITQMQAFMALMQMLMMPLLFLSGALFPVGGLPRWLEVLNRVDPLTYAVDPLRRVVFARLDISAAARHVLTPGVTWWGWRVPVALEVGIVALVAFAMLVVGALQFRRA
jgi:ABC-2 type transport system permease protein